jgi:hypothetical protein
VTVPLPFPTDRDNPLLQPVPYLLITGTIDVQQPAGQLGIATWRTASTTLTLYLTRDEVKAMSDDLAALAAGMSSAGLIAAPGSLLPQNGQRRPGG